MLAEMPVVRFLFIFVRFKPKPLKNLHLIEVRSGYLSTPVVALRGLVPHVWRIAGSALPSCRTKRRFGYLHTQLARPSNYKGLAR